MPFIIILFIPILEAPLSDCYKRKTMRHLFSILLFAMLISCKGQIVDGYYQVPYGKTPSTPSMEDLEALNLIPFEELVIEMKEMEVGKRIRIHKKDFILFNGWTKQLFEDNEHRFRYTHFKDGFAVWQIGYFDNGELDHDFHMKNGMNFGSSRMWQKGGCLYISTHFKKGGINHGHAYAWHENCVLSRDALYDKDRIVYEIKFDTDGEIVEKLGKIPEKYK